MRGARWGCRCCHWARRSRSTRLSRSSRSELDRLGGVPFAHRGLHGLGARKNSRAAFQAAIGAGQGIELDVQASADGEAMVFHDYELARLTDAEGPVARRTSAELRAI